MTAAGEPRRVELEIRFEPEPIQGRLRAGDGEGAVERPFSGWLGLMAAIDAARSQGWQERKGGE